MTASAFCRIGIVAGIAASSLLAAPAAAAPPSVPVASSPVASLDQYEVAIGDTVGVRVDGFNAKFVTVAVCGNGARRGSADCYMTGALTREMRDDSVTLINFTVDAPPVPCPCVLRVSNARNDEVAVVGFTLIGHPSGPVIEPNAEDLRLAASIVASPAARNGWSGVRAALGGPAAYDVTLTVRNLSTVGVSNVAPRAWVGRNTDDAVRDIVFPSPGQIPAAGTWRETVRVELPAATFGDIAWQAAVSGAGPTVTTQDTTRNVPVLLIVLLGVFVLDVILLAVRWVIRRSRRARQADAAETAPPIEATVVGSTRSPDADRELETVGRPAAAATA